MSIFGKSGLVFCALFFLLIPQRGFSWGSFTDFETHQFLLKVAYDDLKQDPAIMDIGFPKLEDILAKEGVYFVGDQGMISGPGPDNPNTTPDSWHYYNPKIRMGGGPGAAAKYFKYMAKGRVTKVSADVLNQATAWSAHFMADMSVPYHVVGLPKSELDTLAKDPSGATVLPSVPLGSVYSDDRYKMNYQGVGQHSNDWKQEVDRFYADAATRDNADYFDPWYWNGIWPMSTKESSHMQWEAWVFHNVDNPRVVIRGYSPEWKNPAPAFEPNWDAYGEQVSELAKRSAGITRDNIQSWLSDAVPALSQAARDQLTIWRASLTGLRAFPVAKPDLSQFGKKIFDIKIWVANLNHEVAAGVKVKLSTVPNSGCVVLPGVSEVALGDLASALPNNTVGNVTGWKVQATDLRTCKVRIEVIAAYSQTPDLQYFNNDDHPDGMLEVLGYTGVLTGAGTSSDLSVSYMYPQGVMQGKGKATFLGVPCTYMMNATVAKDGSGTFTGFIRFEGTFGGKYTAYDGKVRGSVTVSDVKGSYEVRKPGDKPSDPDTFLTGGFAGQEGQ